MTEPALKGMGILIELETLAGYNEENSISAETIFNLENVGNLNM